MMKRLLIITVLIFGVLVAFGQKNVSDKENETAPKTALIEAQKDYQKAVKEKNSPLLIQSLIRQIKYQSLILSIEKENGIIKKKNIWDGKEKEDY